MQRLYTSVAANSRRVRARRANVSDVCDTHSIETNAHSHTGECLLDIGRDKSFPATPAIQFYDLKLQHDR
jgi:hypothetical protein